MNIFMKKKGIKQMEITTKEEIERCENIEKMGCILFDFGCYFPYNNQDVLVFEIALENDTSIDDDILPHQKLNHRYPNSNYMTISKTYGRKICKAGYPIVAPIEELNKYKTLVITVGVEENTVKLKFPIEVCLDENHPVCDLFFRFFIDSYGFIFESFCENEEGTKNELCAINENYAAKYNFTKKDYTMLFTEPIVNDNCSIFEYAEKLTLNAKQWDEISSLCL